jgi:uncharacterized protein YrrD
MAEKLLIDDLRHDATVLSSDGAEVGRLHAIVLDPSDGEVTHVVVNAGPFFPSPGFGAPKLVSVPIDQMEGAEEEDVVLTCSEADFDAMGSYVERDFLPPPDTEEPPTESEEEHGFRPLRTVWNAATALAASFGNQLVGIPVPRETFQVAKFERQIVYDSPVWRVDPHEQLGEVERVLIGHDSDEIEALVIRAGAAFDQDTVLPIENVTEILDGIIRADLTNEQLAALQPFHPD